MATKELISVSGANFAHSNRSLRTIKMLQPIHKECQWPPRREWWKACLEKGHNPYITSMEVPYEEPQYDIDEDGDKVRVGMKTKIRLVEEPNITQVPLDPAFNDGRGPELFQRNKGFVHLEERGFKAKCQMYDCWLDATMTTPYGEFCSTNHARLVGALEEGSAIEVLDQRKRAKQLRDVELTP